MTTDVIINKDKGYWDFEWTDTGDISTAETIETYILMALLEEQRATAAEIPDNALRRGWAGNESTPDFQQGSLVWTFEQERITGSILAELGQVVRNALQPLIDDNIASNVIVENPTFAKGVVGVFIEIFRDGSPVDRKFYELWNNTPAARV